MWTTQVQERFAEIKAYYDAMEVPKYRNAELGDVTRKIPGAA